jgi:uncharacterized ferritin-like protein (DUF455 family)
LAEPDLPDDIGAAARAVLQTPQPYAKLRLSRAMARAWRRGLLKHRCDAAMPDHFPRPEQPLLLAPNRMPKRGRAGSERGRIALLHALAHIEYVAIDLAWDSVGRFGGEMPRAFTDDFVSVAADESMHFALIDRRLRAMGSFYGALPAHAGLDQAAAQTANDVAARLVVVPQILEARALDVTPATIARFEAIGDQRGAAMLQRILKDEIRHVGIGNRWFRWLCSGRAIDSALTFQKLAQQHFGGRLKPPFNDSAREQAGLTRDYYSSLAAPPFDRP